LSPEYVRRTGRPPGFRPYHLVVGGILAVAWIGVLAFVLTHGKGDDSAVDVYSELPPGFTASLEQQGVRYAGLSPVDDATVRQVLTQATTDSGVVSTAANPIVLRTSFTDHAQGASFTDQPALMVVVSDSGSSPQTSGGAASPVFVAFVDPTTYKTLTTVTYDASGASG
jgi:hypothetical protein